MSTSQSAPALGATLKSLIQNQDLSPGDAQSAMREILSGDFPEPLLAAWLVALRMKGESPAEISALAIEMIQHATPIKPAGPEALDIVGTGGDGVNTINISTAAALVAAAAGAKVVKHGNRAVSSISGAADVLAALGVNIELDSSKITECLETCGISFLYAPKLHQSLRHASTVRRMLGFRTVFNLLGPLVNPARPGRMLLGVYQPQLLRTMAIATSQLGFQRVLVVHGSGGFDELSLTGSSSVCELSNGGIAEYSLSPEDFGLNSAPLSAILGGEPHYNAQVIRNIFSGAERGPLRDVVVMNAAAALVIADRAPTWKDAALLAGSAIDSLRAQDVLGQLASFSQR